MPLPARLHVHDYSTVELAQLNPTTKYIFATLPHSDHNVVKRTKLYSSSSLPPFNTSPTFCAFNIYPTSHNSVPIIDLLWTCVNNGAYNPIRGDFLLGARVFALGLTPELHDFLSSVTIEEMHTAIIDFLVLLHHQLQGDGDVESIARMTEDLVPDVWTQVERNIGVFPNGEPETGRRARTLEHLVQISFMTPWRVDVFGAYLTENDFATWEGCQSKMDAVDSGLGVVMNKLCEDWNVFRVLLCDGMGLSYAQAAEAMERAVHARKGGGLLEQVQEVIKCSARAGSWFEVIPTEVLEERVAPWVLRRGCEMIAPRRRKLASLKSLLEMSTRYLEELRAEALPIELEEETEDMVAALLAEGGGEVTVGERVGVGVLTSRVLEEAGVEMETVVEFESLETAVEEGVARYAVDGNLVYPLNEVAWEVGGEGKGNLWTQYWEEEEESESDESEIGMIESESGASYSGSSSVGSSVVSGRLGCEREEAVIEFGTMESE